MWDELGISGGTGIILLIAFYFVIKWAVKNGINESVLGREAAKKRSENGLVSEEKAGN